MKEELVKKFKNHKNGFHNDSTSGEIDIKSKSNIVIEEEMLGQDEIDKIMSKTLMLNALQQSTQRLYAFQVKNKMNKIIKETINLFLEPIPERKEIEKFKDEKLKKSIFKYKIHTS